jgi:ribose transport system ATP-binding protein
MTPADTFAPPHSQPQLPVLRALGLSKRYGQHLALNSVSFAVHPGQVHVLFGENGAGKSTLISMLAGAREPSAGEIQVNGKTVCFGSVAESRAYGIRAVFQEFSLIPMLTVADNITLGEEPLGLMNMLSKSQARAESLQLIQQLGFELDPDRLVNTLPRGKQQMVEICKALRHPPKVLILDEPTASLSEHDAQSLFKLIEQLKARGTAIIYITHRMHEIPLLGDEVTVLRDGQLVATVPAQTPEARLIELMTGRTMAKIYPRPRQALGDVRLQLNRVTLKQRPGTVTVRDASFHVRSGEIVGIAGLVGCGKSELVQACFGVYPLAGGEILKDRIPMRLRHPSDAIAQKVWYSPADRKHDGLALGRSARENMSLSSLSWGSIRGRWLRPRHEKAVLTEVSKRIDFAHHRLREPVSNFSGGNQQKVLLGKGLTQDIDVYLFDEPTVGVDIGARLSIYQCLADLSAAGAAIVMVSSDLPELMGMTHRMLVMNNGRIVTEFQRAEYDEHRILEKFFD